MNCIHCHCIGLLSAILICFRGTWSSAISSLDYSYQEICHILHLRLFSWHAERERETAIYICLIRVPILPIKPLFRKDIHKQETMSHGLYFTLLLSFSMNWIFGIALDIVFEHLNLKLLLVIAFIFLVNM